MVRVFCLPTPNLVHAQHSYMAKARQAKGKRRRGQRDNEGDSSYGGKQSILNDFLGDEMAGLTEAENEIRLFEMDSAARTAAKSTIVNCHGVEIRFPFRPYPSQKDMMDKIVEAIQNQQNALLESPTGSGKSLAIICAALGWLENEKKNLRIKAQREYEEHKARLAEAAERCARDVKDDTVSPYFQTDGDSERHSQQEAPAESLQTSLAGEKNLSERALGKKVAHRGGSNSEEVTENVVGQQSTNVSILDTRQMSNSKNTVNVSSDSTAESDDDFQQDRVKRRKDITIEYDMDEEKTAGPSGHSKLGIDLSKFAYNDESGSSSGSAKRVDGVSTPPEYFPTLPKIFFCSRTHKQIAQLIRELRTKTPYKPSMSVLGSRSQYCVNPKNKSADKNDGCQRILEDSKCLFYLRSEELVKPFSSKIWEIEDIVPAGREKIACPYYASRALAKNADIIFCPYNYIVHPQIRKAMEVNIDNAIVIIDEAHNIEDVARDAGGHDIALDTLETADMQLHQMIEDNIKASSCRTLQRLVVPFKKIISDQTLSDDFEGGVTHLELQKILDELSRFGFSLEAVREMERASETLSKALREKAELKKQHQLYGGRNFDEDLTQEQKDLDALHLSLGILRVLDGLIVVLKRLFDPENDYKEDYKVVITRTLARGGDNTLLEEDRDQDGEAEGADQASRGSSKRNQKGNSRRRKPGETGEFREVRTLSFWCLNPGVVFRELGWGARSVVLTSGTLSPMDSFASELQTTFPITLEASHVVDESQVWAGAFSCGPTQQQLKGVFQTTRTLEYQDEVGQALERIVEVVPNGVLCFMTSYILIENLISRWRVTGQWDRLAKIKSLFVEPRKSSAGDFDHMLREFYAAASGGNRTSGGGALLLAVYRGKCSEGIDFTDHNCRAVVALGIPFPALMDDKVKLKKEYNDRGCKEPRVIKVIPTSIEIPNHSLSEAERVAQEFGQTLVRPKVVYRKLLSGQRWYEIQAFRAYNQAIGRCIRHRKDWGAMIFLDARMHIRENRHALSKWIRPLVRNIDKFDGGIQDLQNWMAPLLEPDDDYWQKLEAKRLEREAALEEKEQFVAAEETRVKQEYDAQLPREQLASKDGEQLLSFCLDTGPSSNTRTSQSIAPGVVKSEPKTQTLLQFKPIKQETPIQPTQHLQFAPPSYTAPPNSTPNAKATTEIPGAVQDMNPTQPSEIRSASGSSQPTTASTSAAHTSVMSQNQNISGVDEIEEFSEDEFHDAPQHFGDGDTSMQDLNDPGDDGHASQEASAPGGSILKQMDTSMDLGALSPSAGANYRRNSVEMQSPPTTPKNLKRQISFSSPQKSPRSPVFNTAPASPRLFTPASQQFIPRVAHNEVQVLCKQCNTRLVICSARPKVQTVHKLIARKLIVNANRPTRTFSRSSSSSSLTGFAPSLGTQDMESNSSSSKNSSQSNGPSGSVTGTAAAITVATTTTARVIPSSAMVLMLPEGSIIAKEYAKPSSASMPHGRGSWQPWHAEGLVFHPIFCWTCRSNQTLYRPQASQAGEGDEPFFGHEEEPGWRGVFVASLAPRLLSFGSGSATNSQSTNSSSNVSEDQGFVGQAWFAPKEIRVVI